MNEKFPKALLQEICQLQPGEVWSCYDCDDSEVCVCVGKGYQCILNDIFQQNSWETDYRLVFKTPEGRFFESSYSAGSTEMQDSSPYEYDRDLIDCAEVYPVEKTVTVYVEKPD